MSHFSTIKTKFKDGDQLIEALIDIGLDDAQHEQSVMVGADREHAKGHPNVEVHITAGNDIGFRWNEETEAYELVTDLQSWKQNIPVERFLQKLHQHYALKNILKTTNEMGYHVEEEHFATDGAIELTVGRWIQ